MGTTFGIVLPDIAVPLGTHTGWAVRRCSWGHVWEPAIHSVCSAKQQRNLARDPALFD
jgi:hypothetical protein